MLSDTATYSESEDHTFCSLIEGEEEEVRLSSWELGLEIASNNGWEWIPIFDDPYMVVFGDDRSFSDSPYVKWYARDSRSVSLEAVNHFRRTVPEEIQEIVEQFRYSQLQLLKALRFCPDLMEVACSCPPLFWLIVEQNCHISVLQSKGFAELLQLKRKEILRQLGYVGTQSAVKLLSKIAIGCFCDEDLFCLKGIMRSSEKIAGLRHHDLLSKAHLYAAENYPELQRYTFVRNELKRRETSPESFKRLASLYEDTCNMAELLRKENMEDFFSKIKQHRQLERRHDAFVAEIHNSDVDALLIKKLLDLYGKETFPSPPVPGSEVIQPILTLPELAREGKEMQNCILTYGQQIYERSFYCYRILKPERGSIGLDMTKGSPSIAEMQLKKNNPPTPATVRAVEEWLLEFKKRDVTLKS